MAVTDSTDGFIVVTDGPGGSVTLKEGLVAIKEAQHFFSEHPDVIWTLPTQGGLRNITMAVPGRPEDIVAPFINDIMEFTQNPQSQSVRDSLGEALYAQRYVQRYTRNRLRAFLENPDTQGAMLDKLGGVYDNLCLVNASKRTQRHQVDAMEGVADAIKGICEG